MTTDLLMSFNSIIIFLLGVFNFLFKILQNKEKNVTRKTNLNLEKSVIMVEFRSLEEQYN